MTDRHWMKFYVADYLADTSHLTTLEHGAYLLLIMHYWRMGGLPDDPKQLARIARMPLRSWQAVEPTIAEFFQKGWSHKRIDDEIKIATEKSEKAQASVNKRWESYERTTDVSKTYNGRNTIQSQSQSQSQNKESITVDLPKTGEAKTPAKRARASDLENPFFEQFWSAYPKREGSNPKQPASQKFSRACQAGIEPQEIIDAAKRYASECDRTGTEPRFVAQAVTWLNQGRWRDYSAPSVALADGSKLPSFASDAEFDKWWQERMASNG